MNKNVRVCREVPTNVSVNLLPPHSLHYFSVTWIFVYQTMMHHILEDLSSHVNKYCTPFGDLQPHKAGFLLVSIPPWKFTRYPFRQYPLQEM